MHDPQAPLKNFPRKHDRLVCVDSDGTALDTMEIKHKECFIPSTIRYWDLQPVARYARAAAEFVNLYSRDRGINRFPALVKTLDLLEQWPGVPRDVAIPRAEGLRAWVGQETRLNNETLREAAGRSGDADLQRALDWSTAVNQSVAATVRHCPPFPWVRESLERLSAGADIMVCSVMPVEALEREWNEHGIARHVTLIAGQEMGGKREHIALAMHGRYEKNRVLMIGDAPADHAAASANGVRFFPICPEREDVSWRRMFEQAAERFLGEGYDDAYEGALIAEFEKLLQEKPSWMM
jgi:phosphoglycolate phosphatase-like HAD superfamily hydrolase